MRALRRTMAAALLLLAMVANPLSAAGHGHQESTSPDALWSALMAGNQRYLAGALEYRHLRAQRDAVKDHQNPPVTVLSCADSRVPPELIFDHSVGQLFVVRVAGNIADPFELASLEFAIANGYTKLIVVMGHEECGAVKAAMASSDPPTPSLVQLVARVREAFEPGMNRNSSDAAAVRHAIEVNTKHTAAQLIAKSDVVRDAVEQGKVKIVTAYYSFDGHVTKLD